MDFLKDKILDLYIPMLDWSPTSRIAMVTFVLGIILWIAFYLILKFVVPFLIYLFRGLIFGLFSLFHYPLYLWVKLRSKSGHTHFPLVDFFESVFIKSINSLKTAYKTFNIRNRRVARLSRTLFTVVILLVIASPFALKNSETVQSKWFIFEHSIVFGEKVSAATSTEEKQEQKIATINKGYNGVNMRKAPSLNSQVITAAGSEETLIFLNESSDVNGVTWYKVKNSYDQVGWVSGNVVTIQ